MPTYRNDGTVVRKVMNSNYVAQSVLPGESFSTLQVLPDADLTKTADGPANPKVWDLTLAAGSTFADNVVDVGAIMKPESGYIKVSASVNMKINSLTGDTITWDATKMGYIWNFSEVGDGVVIDKLYFENPPSSGAVDIAVQVYASCK